MIQGKHRAGMLLCNLLSLSAEQFKKKIFTEVFLKQVLLYIKRTPV